MSHADETTFDSAVLKLENHHLIYVIQGCDGYLFNINTVTNKLQEFCWLYPSVVRNEVALFQTFTDLSSVEFEFAKPRALDIKVQPLGKKEERFNWVTKEALPCAARAIWHKRSKSLAVRYVTAGFRNGLKVCFRASTGPVVEWQPLSAGYGGHWMSMKLKRASKSFTLLGEPSIEERVTETLALDTDD